MLYLKLALALAIISSDSSLSVQTLPTWTVEEVLRIGSIEGPDDAFDQPSQLLEGPDGDLFVPEPRLGLIRRFGPDGRAKSSLGNPGDGPGEFRRVGQMGFMRDTLWAFDPQARRVTLFDLQGSYVDGWPVDTGGELARGSGSVSMSLLLPGRVHLLDRFGWSTATGPVGPTNRTTLRWRFGEGSPEALHRSTIEAGMIAVPGYGAISFQPIRDDPIQLLDLQGRGMLTVERPVSSMREGEGEFRVSLNSFDGGLLAERRITYRPAPFPRATRDSLFQAAVEDFSRQVPRSAIEGALREGLYLPDLLPPVSRVFQGPGGEVWLQRELFGEGPPRVLVLDGELRPVAELVLAGEAEYLHISSSGYFWAIETDELDVAYAVRYRILK